MIKKLTIRDTRRGTNGARVCLAIGVTMAAVACTPAPTPTPTHQTVEYYRANKDVRAAKLSECENDPGALGQTPDCINARQAARQDTKSLRDLAPLNLPETLPYKESRESGRGSSTDDQ